MLTEKDYCDYEICVALRELGCSLSSFEKWENKEGKIELVPHYLLYAAQKWLREEKGIEVNASWDNEKSYWFWYISKMADTNYSNNIVSESIYNSYEEALSEGIKEAVKILKER